MVERVWDNEIGMANQNRSTVLRAVAKKQNKFLGGRKRNIYENQRCAGTKEAMAVFSIIVSTTEIGLRGGRQDCTSWNEGIEVRDI